MSQREAARHFNISRHSVAKMMAFSVLVGLRGPACAGQRHRTAPLVEQTARPRGRQVACRCRAPSLPMQSPPTFSCEG